jgi:hypothetical protein
LLTYLVEIIIKIRDHIIMNYIFSREKINN